MWSCHMHLVHKTVLFKDPVVNMFVNVFVIYVGEIREGVAIISSFVWLHDLLLYKLYGINLF